MKAYGVRIDSFSLGEVDSVMDKKIFFEERRAKLRANDIERDGAELSLQARRCEECCYYDDIDDWIEDGKQQKDFEEAHGVCCALDKWDGYADCINNVSYAEDVYAHVVEFEVED